MAARRGATPHDVLLANRAQAHALVQRTGAARTRKVLEKAERDLVKRLTEAELGPGPTSFTYAQLRATLVQVRAVLADVKAGLREAVVEVGTEAARIAGENAVTYLHVADDAFRGVGAQPLGLNVAAVLDASVSGAQASILRRLATSGTTAPGAEEEVHPGKLGVLDRYGVATIGKFEGILQAGVLSRKSVADMRAELVAASPFLQQAPAHWAERIVRTELMGAYSRGTWEGMREADEQLGDMLKVLAATFDDRTGCLVGETPVAAGVVRAVFRRWYEGPMLRVTTERGRHLTATPNHPMLARGGWLPAQELHQGDYLVCDAGQERSSAAGDKHVTGAPPTLAQVFEALALSGERERRRGREEDFHGDGGEGEVDVLRPHGELRLGVLAALDEPTAQKILAPPHNVHGCPRCGAVYGAGACEALESFGTAPHDFSRLLHAAVDGGLRNVERLADALQRLASPVALGNLFYGEVFAVAGMPSHVAVAMGLGTRIGARHPSPLKLLGDVAQVGRHRCRDFSHRHPACVELDRVIRIEPFSFAGHVFNLSTDDGFFTAAGVFTGNSDSYAVHGQVRLPDQAFQSWFGLYQHPPNRPNDREVIVPHRSSWDFPPYLRWKTNEQVAARWKAEGRKAEVPPRPKMTTVKGVGGYDSSAP